MSDLKQQSAQRTNSEPPVLAENPRIFADFHNADAQGRLRLNCMGTIEDIEVQKLELQTGQHLILYSEDLEVDGIVEYSQLEHLWVAVIDWDAIREVEESASVQATVSDQLSFSGKPY